MSPLDWFSARVRLVILIEGAGASRYADSVIMLRAGGWAQARQRALRLGYEQETTYLNAEGERVAWRLVEILSLDRIEADDLDGVEVHSQFVPLEPGRTIPFHAEFKPEESKPTQTT